MTNAEINYTEEQIEDEYNLDAYDGLLKEISRVAETHEDKYVRASAQGLLAGMPDEDHATMDAFVSGFRTLQYLLRGA